MARVPEVVGGLLLVCYFAVVIPAYVGLLRRWRVARPLYLAAWGLSFLMLALGPNPAYNRLGLACSMLTGICGGMILGLVYFSALADEFAPAPPA